MRDDDNLPTVPPVEHRGTASMRGSLLRFAGGPVDTRGMRASHPGHVTPTTIRNTKLTRPAEQYPGEAERMIDSWTNLATTAIVKARDATDAVRLVSHLEEAAHAIQEALRWAKP